MSALHRVLVDFGRAPEPVPPPAEGIASEPAADRIADAVADALAAAAAVHADALAALADRHAADLADARARWAADEGEALAAGLGRARAAIEAALASAAAAALEPLLDAHARAGAVEGLCAAVGDLVAAGTAARIAVSGPADLVEALRAALSAAGTDPAGLDFAASEAAEVSLTVDDSLIETRLGAWADALRRHRAPADGPDAARAGAAP